VPLAAVLANWTGAKAFPASPKRPPANGKRPRKTRRSDKNAKKPAMAVDATLPYDDQNVFAKILRGEIPAQGL
jgi:hypothetical protein